MLAESVEGPAPERPVRRQPLVELDEWCRLQPVEPTSAVDPHLHEAGVPEHAQVLGDRWLAEAQPVDQVADGALPVTQEIEDLPAMWFGKGGEGHPKNMPD